MTLHGRHPRVVVSARKTADARLTGRHSFKANLQCSHNSHGLISRHPNPQSTERACLPASDTTPTHITALDVPESIDLDLPASFASPGIKAGPCSCTAAISSTPHASVKRPVGRGNSARRSRQTLVQLILLPDSSCWQKAGRNGASTAQQVPAGKDRMQQ